MFAVSDVDNVRLEKLLLGRKAQGERIPTAVLSPKSKGGKRVLVWIHPSGKSSLLESGEPNPLALTLVRKGITIVAPDVFMTGDFGAATRQEVNAKYAGFTYGYNRPLLANRVHDILTAVAFAQGVVKPDFIDLVGFERAGPWTLIARSLCADAVRRTAIDANRFDFAQVSSTDDEMMLPGAIKYGGMTTAAALAAPSHLLIHNTGPKRVGDAARQVFRTATAADHLTLSTGKMSWEKTLDWLEQGSSGAPARDNRSGTSAGVRK